MHVEAGPFGQPVAYQLGFVGAIVIQNQVYVHLPRHVLFDGIEELAEFERTMARLGLADQFAGFRVQSGKQGRSAVARIVMGAPLYLSGAAWAEAARFYPAPVSGSFHRRIRPARDPADRDTSRRYLAPCR